MLVLITLLKAAVAAVLVTFAGCVATFHVRSRGEHAFPKATYALIAFAAMGAGLLVAGLQGDWRYEVAALVGLCLSGSALVVLMTMEMREAAHLPSLRETVARLADEQGLRTQAQAELSERARLLEINAEVGAVIGSAATAKRVTAEAAAILAERLDIGLVRVWAMGESGRECVLTDLAGRHAAPQRSDLRIGALEFRKLVDSRSPLPFSAAAVDDDSKILGRSDLTGAGLEHYANFPFRVEDEIVGQIELFHDRPFPPPQLALLAPIAASIGQAIRRQRSERELRASLERFATLTTVAPVAIFVCRKDGQLVYSNRRWGELTGMRSVGSGGRLASTAALSMRWFDLLDNADARDVSMQWERAIRDGRELNFQARCRLSEASDQKISIADASSRRDLRRPVIGVVRRLPDSPEYLGVLTDVTDLKRAERQARDQLRRVQRLTELSIRIADRLSGPDGESETLLPALVETLLDVFDARFGAIGFVDESVDSEANVHAPPRPRMECRAAVDTAAELPGSDGLGPAGCDLVGDLARIWDSGRPGLSNDSVPSPLQHRRLSGFIAARVSDGDRRIGMILVGDADREFVSADRDLLDRAASILGTVISANLRLQTERARRREVELSLRKQQLELERMARVDSLGELAAGLSHELNQPLAAIVNFTDAIATKLVRVAARHPDDPDLEGVASMLESVGTQSSRAAGIIRNMRNMIQKTIPDRAPVILPEIVDQALELVRPDAKLNGIVLSNSSDAASQSRPIYANDVQIQQVVVNLAQNAIDAVSETPDGRVEIAVHVDGDLLKLTVADNGPGLEGCDASTLFDSFFTTKPEGLGIGLRICRTIVEAHVGRMLVEQSPLGGLQFVVSLPAMIETTEPKRRPAEVA